MKARERRLLGLEAQYREILIDALRTCAQGGSLLLGQNERVLERHSPALAARLRPAELDELLDLGEEIGALRAKLGFPDAFALHERFLKLRASHGPNTPGEPKLAAQWLDELESEDPASD